MSSAGAGLLVSSAAHPFGAQQVGNGLIITNSGTGGFFNLGRFVIASVSAGVATVVGPTALTTGAGVNGQGGLGGAMASPGQAGAVMLAGNDLFIQAGTYTIASATANVATGCLSLPAAASNSNITKLIGYGSVRMDGGTQPILKANGTITVFTMITAAAQVRIENLTINGNARTSSKGLTFSGNGIAYRCNVLSFTLWAISGINATLALLCTATTTSGGNGAFQSSQL